MLAIAGSGSTQAAGGTGPVAVVRAYIAALSHHDGSAVCRLFAPVLRSYEDRSDSSGVGRTSCARVVHEHFTEYYSRHRWQSARIVTSPRVSFEPRTGITAVAMTLSERYVCAGRAPLPRHCHPGPYRRAEIIYLKNSAAGWEIVKPGGVYRASELDSPDDVDDDYLYPPGTPRTVDGPVSLPANAPACPRGTSLRMPPHHLSDPPGNAAWLKITALSAARLSSDRVCFTITLAAPPRPDSVYSVYISTVQQAAPYDHYDVEFDGLGEPHTLLAGLGALGDPRIAHELPHVRLDGDHLELIAADPFFTRTKRFLLQVGSQSTQDLEPLLRHPINAGDLAPLGSCLVVPSGARYRKGLCGSEPAG